MISVIMPAYNEEMNIPLLYERLQAVAASMKEQEFEFVFVDDCSSDRTPALIEELRQSDRRVQLIRFARNCGAHAALSSGLSSCRGELAVILAADLQDPPEVIPALLDKYEQGHKIVWGVREKREGESWLTLMLSAFYYWLVNKIAEVQRPRKGADIVLLDRDVIDAYKQAAEKSGSVFMMITWLGFSQGYIDYVKEARHAGRSKWNFSARVKILIDSMVSFSYVPLRMMSIVGAVSALIGLVYGAVVFVNAARGIPVKGWATIIILILLIGGFQMIMMGLLGEYMWRTYDETRGRPRYVVERNTLEPRTPVPDASRPPDDSGQP